MVKIKLFAGFVFFLNAHRSAFFRTTQRPSKDINKLILFLKIEKGVRACGTSRLVPMRLVSTHPKIADTCVSTTQSAYTNIRFSQDVRWRYSLLTSSTT